MLRDLDVRRKQEEKNAVCDATPVVARLHPAKQVKSWYFALGILVLSGTLWVGMNSFSDVAQRAEYPEVRRSQQADLSKPVPATTAQEVTPKQQELKTAPVLTDIHPVLTTVKQEPIPQETSPRLLEMEIAEQNDQAQISLAFAQLPDYRLLQGDEGASQLIVSFSRTKLGDQFDVPALTDGLIQRVSLLPQRENLQLLVDLEDQARVSSFQLVEKTDDGYLLIVDIVRKPLEKKEQKSAVQAAGDAVQVTSTQHATTLEPATLSKNSNPISREQQAYQAGQKQLEMGDDDAAVANFTQALIINPQLLDARLQLVDTLMKLERFGKAEEQLRQGLVVTPENQSLRKTYARLLLQQQRQGDALELLRKQPVPAISQDLEYHALIAALLQETGEFSAAGELYGRLLQLRPGQAVWWLGLAISLDQTGEPTQSPREAYMRALALPGLRPDLRDYIQNRLQAL